MTTCTRGGGRVLRSPPQGAGSGVMSMTGPHAMTPGQAAMAPPIIGVVKLAGSRMRTSQGKVGGE